MARDPARYYSKKTEVLNLRPQKSTHTFALFALLTPARSPERPAFLVRALTFFVQALCGCEFTAPVFLREKCQKDGGHKVAPIFLWAQNYAPRPSGRARCGCKFMAPVCLEGLAAGRAPCGCKFTTHPLYLRVYYISSL